MPDINEMLRDLERSRFYGSVEVKLEAGRVVLLRKTENFLPKQISVTPRRNHGEQQQ